MQQHNNTPLLIVDLAVRLAGAFKPAAENSEVEKLFPDSHVIRNCESGQSVLVVCDFTDSPRNRELKGEHKFIVLEVLRGGEPHTYFLAFPIGLVSEHRIMKGALDALLQRQAEKAAESTFIDAGYLEINMQDECVKIWPIAQSGHFYRGDATQRERSEKVFGALVW